MKIKITDKQKFAKNIFIVIFGLIIVGIILNIAPGYKRDKYTDIINLVIGEQNLTEYLQDLIYVDEKEIVYLSINDVKNIFDQTIYYDEINNQIITISETKVARIPIGEKEIFINGAQKDTLGNATKINEIIYIPISELTLVYNIDIEYVKETGTVVIDKLDEGMIIAQVEENTTLKYKPRKFSKDVKEVLFEEQVTCFYTTSKGWRQVRTSDGKLGYVKANTLGNEYILRQDMEKRGDTVTLTSSLENDTIINLNHEENVVIKNLFSINDNGNIVKENNENEEEYKIWATITNIGLEKQTNELISEYKTRAALIEAIVKEVSKNKIDGVIINFEGITDKTAFDRFIIELSPRLREIGIISCCTLKKDFSVADFYNTPDYVIVEGENK